MDRRVGIINGLLGGMLAISIVSPAWAESPDMQSVRALLIEQCLDCHGPSKAKARLDLSTREGLLRGGYSGEVVVPGDAEASLLYEMVAHQYEPAMPFGKPALSADQVALIRAWIDDGAHYSAPLTAEVDPESGTTEADDPIEKSDRPFWSFQPLRDVTPPSNLRNGSRHPIDRFLGQAQEAQGIRSNPEASRQTLIRRLSFDLLGLPPSPEEVERFVADPSPSAFETLVDRLLASPRYGERWGRHWLDLARYADSDGYENDLDRPNAYRYRDFVIRALNQDMPYDRFLRWQLAGDEYRPEDPEAVVATGFLTAAPYQGTTPADTEENKRKIRYDEWDNMLATTGSTFLGLTVGCARCHDHKFDPIPTRDYYRMLAAFGSAERRVTSLAQPERQRRRWIEEQRRRFREATMDELGLDEEQKFWLRQPRHFFVPVQIKLYKQYGDQLDPDDEELRDWLDPEALAILEALEGDSRAVSGSVREAEGLVMADHGSTPSPSYLLGRGSVMDRVEEVSLGFLSVLTGDQTADDYRSQALTRAHDRDPADPVLGTTYQRATLAEWMTDPEQGAGTLVARVIVNRLWKHHFGEGLVRTPDDFGVTGDRPAQPELLDWLAAELIAQDWRLKPIHRLIVTSATYRQSTAFDPDRAAIDPSNRLWWRRTPIRLEAEILRDAMLWAGDALDSQLYGPAFRPPIPDGAISTRSDDAYPNDLEDGPASWRRAVYAFIKRSVRNPMGEVWNEPDATATCGRRDRTTVPTQSLSLLNDPFVRQRAHDLARRIVDEVGTDPDHVIARAFELVLARSPRPDERALLRRFLDSQAASKAIPDLAHLLFTLNEFLYID